MSEKNMWIWVCTDGEQFVDAKIGDDELGYQLNREAETATCGAWWWFKLQFLGLQPIEQLLTDGNIGEALAKLQELQQAI